MPLIQHARIEKNISPVSFAKGANYSNHVVCKTRTYWNFVKDRSAQIPLPEPRISSNKKLKSVQHRETPHG